MKAAPLAIGQRVLVDGMMGAGKSTFARALAVKTGLPLVHLDLYYWKPGWTRPSDDQWRETQRALVAADAWIIDGNYNETLDVRLESADTVVYLATRWWVCAARAFRRGLRKPAWQTMPQGCTDSRVRRIRDEWGGMARIWHNRRAEPDTAKSKFLQYGSHATVYVLRTRREINSFLARVPRNR